MFQAEATDLAKILDFDASALDPIISLQKQAANPLKIHESAALKEW